MRCVTVQGDGSACECVSFNVTEDHRLVVSIKRGPWSDRVGMYMLTSAGKGNQLLVYVG